MSLLDRWSALSADATSIENLGSGSDMTLNGAPTVIEEDANGPRRLGFNGTTQYGRVAAANITPSKQEAMIIVVRLLAGVLSGAPGAFGWMFGWDGAGSLEPGGRGFQHNINPGFSWHRAKNSWIPPQSEFLEGATLAAGDWIIGGYRDTGRGEFQAIFGRNVIATLPYKTAVPLSGAALTMAASGTTAQFAAIEVHELLRYDRMSDRRYDQVWREFSARVPNLRP